MSSYINQINSPIILGFASFGVCTLLRAPLPLSVAVSALSAAGLAFKQSKSSNPLPSFGSSSQAGEGSNAPAFQTATPSTENPEGRFQIGASRELSASLAQAGEGSNTPSFQKAGPSSDPAKRIQISASRQLSAPPSAPSFIPAEPKKSAARSTFLSREAPAPFISTGSKVSLTGMTEEGQRSEDEAGSSSTHSNISHRTLNFQKQHPDMPEEIRKELSTFSFKEQENFRKIWDYASSKEAPKELKEAICNPEARKALYQGGIPNNKLLARKKLLHATKPAPTPAQPIKEPRAGKGKQPMSSREQGLQRGPAPEMPKPALSDSAAQSSATPPPPLPKTLSDNASQSPVTPPPLSPRPLPQTSFDNASQSSAAPSLLPPPPPPPLPQHLMMKKDPLAELKKRHPSKSESSAQNKENQAQSSQKGSLLEQLKQAQQARAVEQEKSALNIEERISAYRSQVPVSEEEQARRKRRAAIDGEGDED